MASTKSTALSVAHTCIAATSLHWSKPFYLFLRRGHSKNRSFFRLFCVMGSFLSSLKPDGVQDSRKVYYTSLSDEEWKKRLTEEQYKICRQKGTEKPGTGEYLNTKTPGTYHCVCCDTPLFESSTKFDSGTGWPSYYQPIDANVKSKLDLSIIFRREEVLCAFCDSHLGHVFDDGPPPTGKRYCINSVCLQLKPK